MNFLVFIPLGDTYKHAYKLLFISMASTEKNAETIARAKILTSTPWCNDYEKMISGMVFVQSDHISRFSYVLTENRYDSFVPELRAGRLRARKLVKRYNEYLPDDATDESLTEGRYGILKELIGQIGKGVDIDPPFRVDYGCNIIIGDDFYANFKCVSYAVRHEAQSMELIYKM